MKRLNLAIFEPYPMGQGAGNLRTLWYILKYLDRARFNPLIVSPQESKFLDRFRAWGVEVIVATPPASIRRFGGKVLNDRLLRRLRSAVDVMRYNMSIARLMRERRIDVVYCNSIRALLLAGIGARLAGVPTVWYVKGALDNPLLDRLGFLCANRIIFFCEANRDDRYPWFVRWFRNKIDIVRIGIDGNIIEEIRRRDGAAIRKELDIRPDRVNAVILGQLYPPKGQHFIVQGLRAVLATQPAFMLYIVGDAVIDEYRFYREDLERMIAANGLEAHVTFTGWRSDALEVLAAMDMLIHPSLAEGFGRAVLEAMALGLPVVASKVGGLREIIKDGENGFLVAPGDVATFVDRIGRLAADPALRAALGDAAQREVSAHYMIEDKVRQLENIWSRTATR